MPNPSRDKGNRSEREIVELLRSHGLDAYRIPLSGAVTGFKSDVELRLAHQTIKLESKTRSKGFRNIYRWLAGSDALVIKADREKPLLVIDLERLAQVLATIPPVQAEKATHSPSPDPLAKPPTQEPSLQPIPFEPEVVLIHDDKVYLNRPRYTPLGIALERYPGTVKEGE